MKDLQITAKYAAGKPEEAIGSIIIKAPETVEEAIQMYGPDAVLSNAMANWVVVLQSGIRSGLSKGESAESMQARLGISKMGVSAQKASIDPMAAVKAMWAKATPEERQKILADLGAGQATTTPVTETSAKSKK